VTGMRASGPNNRLHRIPHPRRVRNPVRRNVGPKGGQLLADETVAGIAELFPTEKYPRTR
jgi:hypothetical protein